MVVVIVLEEMVVMMILDMIIVVLVYGITFVVVVVGDNGGSDCSYSSCCSGSCGDVIGNYRGASSYDGGSSFYGNGNCGYAVAITILIVVVVLVVVVVVVVSRGKIGSFTHQTL